VPGVSGLAAAWSGATSALRTRRGLAAASAIGAVLVLALVWRVAAGDAACAAVHAAATKSGKATFYDLAGPVGACNFKPPADDLYVALGDAEFDAAAACGGIVEVTGPRGTVRAKVFDHCPECEPGHLDLSRTAFSKINNPSDGLVNIRYRYLTNPRGFGRLAITVAEGASQYWLALVIDNAGNPLRKVEVRSPGDAFQSLRQEEFNYWTADSGAGPGPFDVRVTDAEGQRVTAKGVDLRPEVVQRTSARLYGAGGSPATAPKATATGKPRPSTPPSTEPAVSATAPATPGATSPAAVESQAYRSTAAVTCG
jgi:expansin (peptidoglycan-binding protein)